MSFAQFIALLRARWLVALCVFALVAGDLGQIKDTFKTMSGRTVNLAIYVEHGKEARATYAMEALKRSMAWDEKAFGRDAELSLKVEVPVTSLCPCSKKISDYGAHNQRSHLTLSVLLREDMSLEELVRIAEEEASCEIFGLLKRPDEKWVTERAYDNPKFVEDLVRDVALRLRADSRIAAWTVESENFESIHNHSAYALIEGRNDCASAHQQE